MYHTSYQGFEPDPETAHVLVARYHDELVRTAEGWKISKLVMEILWGERRQDLTGYLAEVGGRGPNVYEPLSVPALSASRCTRRAARRGALRTPRSAGAMCASIALAACWGCAGGDRLGDGDVVALDRLAVLPRVGVAEDVVGDDLPDGLEV